MNIETIIERITYLRNAIAYSRVEDKIISTSQRIACNQEIAAWFGVLDYRTREPFYKIPAHLEEKVKQVNTIISKTNWEKPFIDYA